MPGKLCRGSSNPELERTPLPMESQVFCDGRSAQIAGDLKSTNPWPNDANDADYPNRLTWDQGWDHAQANPTTRGCCAE